MANHEKKPKLGFLQKLNVASKLREKRANTPSKPFKTIRERAFTKAGQTRDVHRSQDLERGEKERKTFPVRETVFFSFIMFFATIGTILVGYLLFFFYSLFISIKRSGSIMNLQFEMIQPFSSWWFYGLGGFTLLLTALIVREKLLLAYRSRMSMVDTTDINQHENDQNIMLPEVAMSRYDWFPDAGAHSSVQVSSMLSHVMISNKGLSKIETPKRYTEDVIVNGKVVAYQGEVVCDDDGEPIYERVPLIDEKLGQRLFTSMGIPLNEKLIRTPFNTTKIEYNPIVKGTTRKYRTKMAYDRVSEMINNDWEFPDYEVQRPAGAYLVDTEPVNTMIVAITRAGKGQTVIEPTIDMWTREKRQNNIVINDPKGELLRKFFVPATVRGYEIVQFNLINPLNTDIYNPLGFAAEAAREGDFTKAASYVENIGKIFFPEDGADNPMWPQSANNAFKRSAFGLIDYFLEEEAKARMDLKNGLISEKELALRLDDMWGKVTLYNAYQFFVVLSAKKSDDPDTIHVTDDDTAKEKDYLTLFFDATNELPQNEMRKLVQNADNSLRAMAGSDKTIASVYGIALTAMSFFTDPTISMLTSGKPSQNFDTKSLSFPRRMGVRFSPEFLERFKLVGMESVWSSYEDMAFQKELDPKLFGHTQIIDRQGWARYFFDGKYTKRKNYVKLQIRNPRSGLLIKTFYFEIELSYKTDLSGRRYIKDPVLGTKMIRDGVMRELNPSYVACLRGEKVYPPQKRVPAKKDKNGKLVRPDVKKPKPLALQDIPKYRDTTIKRRYFNITTQRQNRKEERVSVNGISKKYVSYTERPKAVFFITPPHLMSYAKIILILIKQMVDVNFESSYLTKADQKPLYKTRYMLDEVGNLRSEGSGIPNLDTLLSIGLGQDQQFTLILQTIQQLRDVYGESVDKVIAANTENIVFLKSTDTDMIDAFVKSTGITHKTSRDQKSITLDNERLLYRNDARITYTLQTSERPVISFNDFMFIPERNSIILKAGVSPLWNHNETAYPMSYELLGNTISIPGKKAFTLQTIPTNSSARDFDVRKNQPDFFAMLNKRLNEARLAPKMKDEYLDAYFEGDESLYIKADPNVIASDIMESIYQVQKVVDTPNKEDAVSDEEHALREQFDDLGVMDVDTLKNNATENVELTKELHQHEQMAASYERIYAKGRVKRSTLRNPQTGMISHQFDKTFLRAYREVKSYMGNSPMYRVERDELILAETGEILIRSTLGSLRDMKEELEQAAQQADTSVYTDGEAGSIDDHYVIEDAFIQHMTDLNDWGVIADGRFEQEFIKAYDAEEADMTTVL